MITVQSCREFDRSEWETLVEHCGGTPLHLPEVHVVDCRPQDLRYLVVREAADVVACCLGFIASKRILGMQVGNSVLRLPTAPAVRSGRLQQSTNVYRAMATAARDMGCRRLVVERNWGDDFSCDQFFARWIGSRSIDFTIDLTRSLESILGSMQKYHRKNIRRAERNGLTVLHDCSESALQRLRELQLQSAERATGKGNPFSIRDDRFFRRLYDAVYGSGIGDILFAKVGDECVAALAYLATNTRALTVRSGTTETGNELLGAYLLQFELIRHLKGRGLVELNIGAVPADAAGVEHPQHGWYKFKRGWGGAEHLRTAIDVDLTNLLIEN